MEQEHPGQPDTEVKHMIREVFPNIFLNEIPLPHNPLKSLNSYILVSDDRNLIIDTGFNMKACKDALMKGVEELNIDLSHTDLVLTHLHVDHVGLADELRKLGCRVRISQKDGDLINVFRMSEDAVLEEMCETLDLEPDDQTFSQERFGKSTTKVFEYTPITEGDVLKIGTFELEVISIPGHTPGHIGLYERKNRLFFCGDHILNEITPNITFWGYDLDSLGNYLDSLNKIYNFKIDLVLSAHRSLIKDYRKRIIELKIHHQERLEEITKIISEGEKTASQTASKMHWDLSYNKWEDFPESQKYFAAGEAMSHLEHLVHKEIVQRIKVNGKTYYKIM